MSRLAALSIAMAIQIAGAHFAEASDLKCAEFSPEIATTAAPPQNPGAMRRTRILVSERPDSADVVLLGDSQFESWNKDLQKQFGTRVWNFSVGYDRTQNILWRLDQIKGEMKAKAVVIFAGTNNLSDGGMDGCGTYEGIKAIASKAKKIWKKASIFVLTIPPRGADFLQYDEERQKLNALILKISSDLDDVHAVDIDDKQITCRNYGKPALEKNTLACLPEQAYQCTFYKDDHLHLSSAGLDFLRLSISTAINRKLGRPLL
jgi:hypothetical protein